MGGCSEGARALGFARLCYTLLHHTPMTSGLCHKSGPEGVDFGIVSEAPSEGSCMAGWRVSHTGRRQGQVELLTKLRGKPKFPAAHGVWGGSSLVGVLHMLSKKFWSLGIPIP